MWKWLIKNSKWVLNNKGQYSWERGLTGAGTGAMTGAAMGSVVPGLGTAAGAGIGTLLGAFGGFGGGGDEYEQPEFYSQRLPEWMAPTRVPGREAEFYQAPTYPWQEGILGKGIGYLQDITGAIGRGEVPDYLTRMGEAIRAPAVAELEAGFGRAAGLMGESIAGRGLKLRGGAGQAGARALAGEFTRARGGLEQDIARQMFGETAGLARQLPSWLMQAGQISPQAQFVGPTEQWWTPGVAGFLGQPPSVGGTTGGFELGQMLPWLQTQGQGTQGGTYTGYQQPSGLPGGQTWSPY